MRALLASVVVAALAASALADGNVVGVVSGKTLTLTGDAGSNWVVLAPGGATDAVAVTLNSGTTLNGAGAATFAGVRNVVVSLGAGNDRVDVNSLKLRGGFKADLGDGNDSVYFNASAIRGKTSVRCGAGLDLVRTDSSAVFYGPVNVKGDAGNDEIQIVNAQFRNRLHVEGGADDDHVLLQSVACRSLSRAEVAAGRGRDLVEVLFSTFDDDVRIDAGVDDDRVRLASTRFGRDLTARGGFGRGDVASVEGGNVFVRPASWDGFEEGEPR